MIVLKKENRVSFNRCDEKAIQDVAFAINALPGIELTMAFRHHRGDGKFEQFFGFSVDEGTQNGLFFLARSCDERYWGYGQKWNITIDVADSRQGNRQPICYWLRNKDFMTEEEILIQLESLYENINAHFHHNGFMSAYRLDPNLFVTVDEVAYNRNKKLDGIL